MKSKEAKELKIKYLQTIDSNEKLLDHTVEANEMVSIGQYQTGRYGAMYLYSLVNMN